MNLVPRAVTRKLAMEALRANKNAPAILFGVGIVGVVGSTVLACRATLRLEDELEIIAVDLDTVRDAATQQDSVTPHESNKALAVVYVAGVGRIIRLYGPAVLVGGVSVLCLTKSHQILVDRNLGLTAAYAAVDQGFKRYRANVTTEYGEHVDRQMRYDVEECVLVDEFGQEYVNQKNDRINIDHDPSMYAKFFDQLNEHWAEEPEYNLAWLKHKQDWFNHLLTMRGYVFLNEIYTDLGFDATEAGDVVGWLVGNGDGYIDFGIFAPDGSTVDFVNGREAAILIDFNVDGSILGLYDQLDHSRIQGFRPWQR